MSDGDSIVKMPIDIMTEEQAKEFTKAWKKAVKEARHKGHEHEPEPEFRESSSLLSMIQ